MKEKWGNQGYINQEKFVKKKKLGLQLENTNIVKGHTVKAKNHQVNKRAFLPASFFFPAPHKVYYPIFTMNKNILKFLNFFLLSSHVDLHAERKKGVHWSSSNQNYS